MATMWSKNREFNPANLFSSLSALVEAYDLEAGETVYICRMVNGYALQSIWTRFLTEADLREFDRIYCVKGKTEHE